MPRKNLYKITAILLVVVFTISYLQVSGINFKNKTKIHNLIWIVPTTIDEYENELTNPQVIIEKINGSNIDCIAIYGGFWEKDGTILYDQGASFSGWTNFIKSIKDWNPEMKVIVWVNGWNDICDLRNSTIRAAMCNSAKELLTAVPFDGWNEDYEGGAYYGVSYLLSFYHELSLAIKSTGKIATVATEVDWGGYEISQVYPYLDGFDYVTPMFYGRIADESASTYWNQILSNSSIPVLMGLAVAPDENGGMPFSQQMKWIDNQSKSNLAGFSIWCYDYMAKEDFSVWDKWTMKDNIS
jgi:hypothetical protein